MTHTIELAPEVEHALSIKARRKGVAPDEYLRGLVERAIMPGSGTVEALYKKSLDSDGELTSSSLAQEDLYSYSADELAAMEAGEFDAPLTNVIS